MTPDPPQLSQNTTAPGTRPEPSQSGQGIAMSRHLRLRARLAALAAVLGLVLAVAAPAGANTTQSSAARPQAGACAQQWWANSEGWFTHNVWSPNAPGCNSNLQFKVACGVYGIPSTYYWYSFDFYNYNLPDPQNSMGTDVTNTCPYWGNDIVIDVGVFYQSPYNGSWACFRQNRHYWVFSEGGFCHYATPFGIEWGVS